MTNLLKISEAASLALHTMALLAAGNQERLTNSDLASRLGASSHHLAKVMQRLARAGLIDSVRGPQGGFRLGQPAENVKLLAIYEAVEGPLDDGGCLLGEPICEAAHCVLGEVVQSVHQQIRDYLAKTSLSEVAHGVPVVSPEKMNETI